MLEKKTGIVFRSIKYGESSRILDLYCLETGLSSFIVSGVAAAKKGKINPQLIRPFAIVDVIVYPSKENKLARIKELSPNVIYQSLPFDMIKGAMGTFMIELASKTIKEIEANPPLYHFLKNAFVELDSATSNFYNNHLYFMLELCAHLGFEPSGFCCEASPYFDCKAGQFVRQEPLHLMYLDEELSKILDQLLHANEKIKLSTVHRRALMEKLLDYYRIHIESMPQILSHKIMMEVLSE